MLLDTGRLSFADNAKLNELNVVKMDLLTTSEKSFYRTNLSEVSLSPKEGEEVGKQVVGAVLEKSIEDKTSKLIVYANNMFATDAAINIQAQTFSAVRLYNNLDLVLNSVEYISEVEDKITIRKDIEMTTYTATESQDLVVKIIIFVIPVLIIIFGVVVWGLRRRKK